MIRLLIASILFFIPLGGFADERHREIEKEALSFIKQATKLKTKLDQYEMM